MEISSHFKGIMAEDEACDYLQQYGLRLIEKNYRSQIGEIDLIMQDADYIVFIEVRFRKKADYGNTLETITPGKQRRIIRTALLYLQEKNILEKVNCRFDCIGIDSLQNKVWIKDAFQVRGYS
jgi:putative endonuclease